MQQRVLLFSLVLLCAGCSSSQLAPSVGTVSFADGEPVRAGSIEFRATSDGARYSSRIGASGEFELMDAEGRKGINPGNYDVIVLQIVLTEDLSIEEHDHGHTVPRRYADYYTSDLKYTVDANKPDRIKVVVGVE